MAEGTVESNSVCQLPLVVLTKMASMLPRKQYDDEDEVEYTFKARLRLAAVSRQLRQAVLSSIQQRKRRHMQTDIHHDYVSVAGINVKNEPRSAYTQMDCIDALLAFVRPTSFYLNDCLYDERKLWHSLILMRSLPLSLTSLVLVLPVDEFGVDSPLDQILKAVASKTNLETLKIDVRCYNYNYSAAVTHKKSSPLVPKNSPFNRLLTLENLRALKIDIRASLLLSPAQMADLLNRSQSKITHICCWDYSAQERDEVFTAMRSVARGNITSLCCLRLWSFQADELRFFARLPNCTTIHFRYWSYVSRQEFGELGDWLLDVCCKDDVHPGRTLECSVGCYYELQLQQYVENGGETQMEYARGDTVVRLLIGSNHMMEHKHCPFSHNPL